MNNTGLDRHAKITSLVFAAVCVLFSIALLLLPKSDWSDIENRKLADFPDLSAESLASGEYFMDVEDYLADHFPLRDIFVSVNTRFNMLLGRREINDVFICDDGFLIDKYQTPARTQKILDAFNRIPGAVGERAITLLVAPTAAYVYSEKLPAFAQQADQLETLKQLYDGFSGGTVDVTQALLEHKNDHQLYYRTDHHWTTYGAYYAYVELCGQLGLEPTALDAFDVKRVAEDFCGTTYSKVNDFSVSGEAIYRFDLPSQNISASYGSSGEAAVSAADAATDSAAASSGSDALYNAEYLDKKDKYSYFLNNINAVVSITNDSAQTGRELVVIKDSYANCFVPFLAEHFSRIFVIDPRYYRDSIIDFINSKNAVTDVLILYNLGTIDNDTGVAVIF